MAKSFSPAGMAIKGFFGLGARTFGNPDGALKGGGAYAAGGANPDGPDQGGGGAPPALVWHQRNPVATMADVVFGGPGFPWVAVGENHSYRSLDGKVWALSNTFAPNVSLLSVGHGGTPPVFSAMGQDTGTGHIIAFTAPDGITWTAGSVPATAHQSPLSVCGNPPLNTLFLGDDTPGPLRSADGGNWLEGTPFPTSSGFGYIYWDGTQFLVCESSNAGCPGPPAVLLTPDGLTYAEHIATELNPFAFPTAITLGQSSGSPLYVLVDSRGEISTSPTAAWNGTLRSTSIGSYVGVDYDPGTKQFMACRTADSGDGDFATSNNGIAWTFGLSGSAGLGRMRFGSPFFVSVGSGGIWTFGPPAAG